MAKLYGSLTNRLEENKNYTNREIRVGDDITMYYWSDRKCYFITRVINQKHIFVKPYEVVADQEKEGGMGHQNWLYFKTVKECNDYLNKFGKGTSLPVFENSEEEWMFRYGKWYQVSRYNKDTWQKCLNNAAKDCKNPNDADAVYKLARFYIRLTDEEFNKIQSGKEIVKYYKLQSISFGVRNYYYDWEF